jgi:hypothetical protein
VETTPKCPRCSSDEVLPVAYGMPSPEMVEELCAAGWLWAVAWSSLMRPTLPVRTAATSGALMRRRLSWRWGPGLYCTPPVLCVMPPAAKGGHIFLIIPRDSAIPSGGPSPSGPWLCATHRRN